MLQPTLPKFGYGNERITVSLSYADILISILKFVAVDGRPFEVVRDEGFQHLIAPLLKAMPARSKGGIYVAKVRDLVHNVAEALRNRMKATFAENGNILSISLDGGEYHNRKFLAIIAQCRNVSNIREFNSYSIGTVELMAASTGENLKMQMMGELHRYGIEEKNIISITTDGAANYKKIAKIMNKKEKEKGEKAKSKKKTVSESRNVTNNMNMNTDIENIVMSESDCEPEAGDSNINDTFSDDDYSLEDMFICLVDEEEEMLAEHFELEMFFNHKLPCLQIENQLTFIGK